MANRDVLLLGGVYHHSIMKEVDVGLPYVTVIVHKNPTPLVPPVFAHGSPTKEVGVKVEHYRIQKLKDFEGHTYYVGLLDGRSTR